MPDLLLEACLQLRPVVRTHQKVHASTVMRQPRMSRRPTVSGGARASAARAAWASVTPIVTRRPELSANRKAGPDRMKNRHPPRGVQFHVFQTDTVTMSAPDMRSRE